MDYEVEYHKIQAALSVAIADHFAKDKTGRIIGVIKWKELGEKLLVMAGEK